MCQVKAIDQSTFMWSHLFNQSGLFQLLDQTQVCSHSDKRKWQVTVLKDTLSLSTHLFDCNVHSSRPTCVLALLWDLQPGSSTWQAIQGISLQINIIIITPAVTGLLWKHSECVVLEKWLPLYDKINKTLFPRGELCHNECWFLAQSGSYYITAHSHNNEHMRAKNNKQKLFTALW